MKKLLTIIVLAFICANLKAQIYVDGIPLDSTNSGAYIIITRASGYLFIGKESADPNSNIEVDYGQPQKPTKGLTVLTDKNAEAIKFKSIVGALNYFDKNGWEVLDVIDDYDSDTKSYLLRKKRQ